MKLVRLRQVRGLVGTGITWAVVWAAAPTLVAGVLGAFDIGPGRGEAFILGLIAAIGAALGLIGGTLFAIALSVGERDKSISELHLGRVAGWGALSGALVPIAFVGLIRVLFDDRSGVLPGQALIGCAVVAAAGAASAVAMVAAGRSGSRPRVDPPSE